MKQNNSLWVLIVVGLIGSAIADQLRLPAEQRTWHGKLWNRIPYDFRIPTLDRLKQTFWNSDTSSILVPHAFGVGWSLNFYPLIHPMLDKNA